MIRLLEVMIEFKSTDKLTNEEAISVFDLLCEVDSEFIPHLSNRDSSAFTFDSELINEVKPESYFEEIKLQKFILAFEENTLLGFLTYKENYETRIKRGLILKGDYITTVAIGKKYRGKGIGLKMYLKLIDISKGMPIYTRTWSTNQSHIKILDKLGFSLTHLIKNERGLGIDTVYFLKDN